MTTKPREVGILFRGDMVRAILAGAKTETRRPIRNRDGWRLANPSHGQHGATIGCYHAAEPHFYADCDITSRWAPSDRLWVRETWRSVGWRPENGHLIEFQADKRKVWRESPIDVSSSEMYNYEHPDRWRPSIFTFRWVSRITLPVLAVRAERLTSITDAGTVAEGFVHAGLGSTAADYCREYRRMHGLAEDADPWVWVISFGPAEVAS